MKKSIGKSLERSMKGRYARNREARMTAEERESVNDHSSSRSGCV